MAPPLPDRPLPDMPSGSSNPRRWGHDHNAHWLLPLRGDLQLHLRSEATDIERVGDLRDQPGGSVNPRFESGHGAFLLGEETGIAIGEGELERGTSSPDPLMLGL